MTDGPDAFAPAARVAGFAIERELGRGATGVVYLATAGDGTRVALKVLHRASLDAPGAVTRFEREARALRSVRHAGLVPLVAAGRLDDGRPYLATAWIDGVTLRDALRARRRFAPDDAWRVLEPVAEALVTAHGAGVVHRDLKPENVVLDASGAPHVLDFGIAKTPRESTDAKLTATGFPLGTPAYMSPEQWWNQSVDAATDQYALGVMAFELIAGRLPFAEERYVAMMQAHLAAEPPTLAQVGVAASPAVEAWLARLLAKDAASRFDSMRAALDAGRAAFVGAAPARDRRVVTVAIALAAPAALIALGYTGSHDPRQWAYIAGWGVYPVLFTWLLALTALARDRPVATVAALGALPLLTGSFATYMGWQAVLRALGRFASARHFEVFNEGMSEANANRFLGFGLAAGVFAALPARARIRPSREAAITAFACGAFALLAAVLGAPGAALVSGAAALAVLSRGPAGPTRGDVLRDDGLRLAAMLCAAGCALARTEAREAALWAGVPTRAERVAELLASSAEHSATLVVSAIVAVALMLTASLRVRSAPRTATSTRPSRPLVAACIALACWMAGDLALHARVRARHEALWAAMAPQFALFARLDPPAGAVLATPALGLAIQITPDVVALDGVRVGPSAGLVSDAGRTALSVDLAHALARRDGEPHVLLMVDRHVRWSIVRGALRVARGLGVHRVDVLYTRGESPRWSGTSPSEATYALPRDFGALPVRIATDAGIDASDDAPWSDLAAQLAAGRTSDAALRVGE